MDRETIRFRSADSDCVGWFYAPAGAGPYPTIVMAHGLGAIKHMRLPAFAERFVAAGYACLLFDYRHFGDSEGEPRQLLDVGREQADWRAALDYVRARPDVDLSRIAIWGTSFAGGHVIHTAARDQRLAAVISQCPFTSGPASALVTNPISSAKVTAMALADRAGSLLGRAPIHVATAGAPGSASLMATADAVDGYLGIVPNDSPFENFVAARVALQIATYQPGRDAAKVIAPILFCICEQDTVAPSGAAVKFAAKAPKGETKLYPIGHFDIYVGDGFEVAVADQLEFLGRHLR
jgi:fermentation-respiration switch protein FrsA (DUF1100 family)